MTEKKVVDLTLTQWGKNRTEGTQDWRRNQRRRMRHHSRLVVFLKVILPSFAAVLVGLVIIWPQLTAQQEEAISLLSMETSEMPQDQMMVNPRFFTVDEKGEPLNVTASNAYELPGEERRIQLNEVKADLLRNNDQYFLLEAKRAVYMQADDAIELLDQVNLYTEDGYEVDTTQAKLHLKDRSLSGQAKTIVRTPVGNAESMGFEVLDNGKVVRLSGKTKIIFYPDRKEDK